MLDRYLYGTVDRVSPEAPVPVLKPNKEEIRLGGAANVALNLSSLGSKVNLVGISGKDSAQLVQLMTCRDLSKSKVGKCYYAPIIDGQGNLVNDPIINKLVIFSC